MFTGRPAYVWLSNQYSNTGIDFARIGASYNTSNMIPSSRPVGPAEGGHRCSRCAVHQRIDLIDPNFKFPSVLRGNIGWDRKLPWGMVGTAELLWSKTLEDIAYRNVNLQVNPTFNSWNGRPYMVPVVSTLSNAPLLTNTTKGYTYNLSYEVRKPVSKNGLLHGGVVFLRRGQVRHGRHVRPGHLELGQRLHAGILE